MSMQHTIQHSTLSTVLSAVLLSGCHHMVPIVSAPATPAAAAVAVSAARTAGHEVRVTLHNGNRATFVVGDVRPEALFAEDGRRFNYADIARLEESRVSTARTAALIVASPFIALILVGLTYHGE